MKKIKIIVENSSDGMFWCYTEDSINNIGLNACGKSVAEAKKDLTDCITLAKEEAESRGEEFPYIEFVYKYDLQSFFDYFSFLNVTEIARRAGINPSLMRQYRKGIKHAGEKTYKRLADCIENIKTELQEASF